MRLKSLAATALAGLALVAVGCGSEKSDSSSSSSGGSASSGSAQVDLSNGQKVELSKGKLNVDLFLLATSNEWLQNVIKGAKESAAKYDWNLRVHDAQFDASKQLNQIQNAIQKGDTDAALLLPVDSNLLCKPATKQLPAAGIVTVLLTVPACGHEADDGENSYEPGTLSFVGGSNTSPFLKAWFDIAAKKNPGAHKVALFQGPEISGQSRGLKAVVDEWQPSHPDYQVTQVVSTDYTTPDSLAKARALFKAHPEIDIVMSAYAPDTTRGVVQALEESGKAGKIPVIDLGGPQWSFDQVKKGNIQLTLPYFPVTIGREAVSALKLAQDGQTVPHFIDEQKGVATSEKPLVITKDNLSDAPKS
jgi:ribose transport system substrate-binding protein